MTWTDTGKLDRINENGLFRAIGGWDGYGVFLGKYARRKIERREVTPTMEHVGKKVKTRVRAELCKLLSATKVANGVTVCIVEDELSSNGWLYSEDAKIKLDENDEVVE